MGNNCDFYLRAFLKSGAILFVRPYYNPNVVTIGYCKSGYAMNSIEAPPNAYSLYRIIDLERIVFNSSDRAELGDATDIKEQLLNNMFITRAPIPNAILLLKKVIDNEAKNTSKSREQTNPR